MELAERCAASILSFPSCLRRGLPSWKLLKWWTSHVFAKPYTQAQLATEIARLLPEERAGF